MSGFYCCFSFVYNNFLLHLLSALAWCNIGVQLYTCVSILVSYTHSYWYTYCDPVLQHKNDLEFDLYHGRNNTSLNKAFFIKAVSKDILTHYVLSIVQVFHIFIHCTDRLKEKTEAREGRAR